MCGIVGIVHKTKQIDKMLFLSMLEAVKHRGPENQGFWFSSDHRVALGHQRLAIIDVSSAGNQPMQTKDGRYSVTFNGEIYNYLELKSELEKQGIVFHTMTDTEVLLQAYVMWGKKCVEKLNGMFSFGIWDEFEKVLFIARDHVGEKPLKYYHNGDTFIFASEVKAILREPSVTREIDWDAIDVALSFRYVPAPHTGFRGINKLPAGHYLVWKQGKIEVEQYWFPEQVVINNKKTEDEWKAELWDLFVDSVRKRLMSDVPLGALLSGGLDSTSVVAAVREITDKKIDTFVISIGGVSKDEEYAQKAADYFQTNHHRLSLSDIDFTSQISRLVSQYDEPFFDQAALPTLMISEVMKKNVTVVLSGDGGDELFGGYDAYTKVPLFKLLNCIPGPIRYGAARLVRMRNNLAYKAEITAQSFEKMYTEYYSMWKTSLPVSHRYITKTDLYLPELKKNILDENALEYMKKWFKSVSSDLVNNAMLADIKGRLADGYLAKVDFSSMAHAIEIRAPFLDPRLVQSSLSMPSKLKIKNGRGKYIWKEIVKGKIPESIMLRPKAGFGIPLHALMIKEMKGLIEGVLLSNTSEVQKYFSRTVMIQMWNQHIVGVADYSNHLWSLLMLELWLKKYHTK